MNEPAQTNAPPRRASARGRAVVPGIVAAVVVFAGLAFLLDVAGPAERRAAVDRWRRQLSAMADDRKAAIERWMSEGMDDAALVASFPSVIESASSRAGAGRAEAALDEHVHMILAQTALHQSRRAVWLFDAEGRLLGSSSSASEPDVRCRAAAMEAAAAGSPSVTFAPRGIEPVPAVLFTAPLAPPPSGGKRSGAVVVDEDPKSFLYPLLGSKLIDTSTGETLLVQGDGDSILLLAPLRHGADPLLPLRLPRRDAGLVAAAAVEGREGFGEFTDDRGSAVFAVTRRIRRSPWALLVKVDRDEALMPYRRRVRNGVATAAIAVIGLLGALWGTLRGRRATHEAQREADRGRFAALLDHASDSIFLIGPDLRIRDSNRRAEEVYGYTREELQGKHVRDDLTSESSRKAFSGHLDTAVAIGQTVYETVHRRKDGTEMPVEVSTGTFDVGGEAGFLKIVRNVTERKRLEAARQSAEEALARSEERLRLALGASEDAIWDWDVRTGALYYSPEYYTMLGYGPDELPPTIEQWKSLVHPEDDRVLWGAFEEQVVGGSKRKPVEYRIRAKNGSYRWILVRAKATARDARGAPLRVVGINTDVTERHEAEEGLRKLSRAVEQSPVSIVITDRRGLIEYVNPKFTSLTGYTFEEVKGGTPRILKSGETPPETYKELWRTITSGGEWRGQLLNSKKNGETFWEEASISPIIDGAGRITHFVAVKEDISQRKRLEAQLFQAQKMEAVGLLAGGVAHDFNNILTVISGYTAMLTGAEEPGSSREEPLREIGKAAERAASLTRQLLAFSRRQVLEPKALDLNFVVTDMTRMLRRMIGEDVQLVTVAGPGLGTVVVDPGQIEQVLLNLAVNARDAMPAGGRLTLETANVELDEVAVRRLPGTLPGSYVLLTMRDTGHGIRAEHRDRIFEPFFTTKESGKGTGLGLATVYGIVKQSGGSIYVESEEGVGTRFLIYLPRVERAAPVAEVAAAPDAGPRGSETILLVEDQDEVRKIACLVLEGRGYRVLAASNAKEALDRANEAGAGLDLLVTDVVMPGMSGRVLAEQLLSERPGLRVLFMTGYTSDVAIRAGLVQGGVALLQKPFPPESLARKVREVLESPAPTRAA